MTHVDALDLPPRSAVVFKPGGYHLMMMQPARRLTVGEKVPVTLQFAGGGEVTAQFEVRGPGGRIAC